MCALIEDICGSPTDIDGEIEARCAGNGAEPPEPTEEDLVDLATIHGCAWDGSSNTCIGGDANPTNEILPAAGCAVVEGTLVWGDGSLDESGLDVHVGSAEDSGDIEECITAVRNACAETDELFLPNLILPSP